MNLKPYPFNKEMASPQKQGMPFLILSLSFLKLHNISKAPPRRTEISIFASLRNIENYLSKTKRLKDIIHRHLPDCISQPRWRLATEIYTLQIRTAVKICFITCSLGLSGITTRFRKGCTAKALSSNSSTR